MKIACKNGENTFRFKRVKEDYGVETYNLNVGDIVRLKPSLLKSKTAISLAETGHRFVILGISDGKARVATITSNIPVLKNFSHYVFLDWESERFAKPCGANLQSSGEVPLESIRTFMGELSLRDMLGVQKVDAEPKELTQVLESKLRRVGRG